MDSLSKSLEQACHDILYKNMGYKTPPNLPLSREEQELYLLYDTESPLARLLSDAYISILTPLKEEQEAKGVTTSLSKIHIREFKNPPQPLYRWGFINQENPHSKEQNRVITAHNVVENREKWLDHDTKLEVKKVDDTSLSDVQVIDPQIESIKNELISLPKGSIVVLVQSTNFRLSTFRIRLELFHRGIHVVEHNHLSYIPEEQFPTFIDSLAYRSDEYVRLEKAFQDTISRDPSSIRIQSVNGDLLTFGPVEKIRGNTGDYSLVENKGGTFPIGEIFTEAVDLSSVSGVCWVDTFPQEDFSIAIVEPFRLEIENGRVLPSPDFPPTFQKLYDWVVEYEGEVMVRELGFGLNPAISTGTPLRDINFHERKVGVHLSLGKKHGIYGKKLPKTEVQRFHIDVFIALRAVYIWEDRVFEDGRWTI